MSNQIVFASILLLSLRLLKRAEKFNDDLIELQLQSYC